MKMLWYLSEGLVMLAAAVVGSILVIVVGIIRIAMGKPFIERRDGPGRTGRGGYWDHP